MDAVFEWGWGISILGISRTGPVEVFIPVIMFSVLFGLSMDYEVFLVSRMQEEWIHSHDNRLAVTKGQTETGQVIAAAALIASPRLLVVPPRRKHHHPAVRYRSSRSDHHRRLHRSDRARAGAHASRGQVELVAPELARPHHPAYRGPSPEADIPI